MMRDILSELAKRTRSSALGCASEGEEEMKLHQPISVEAFLAEVAKRREAASATAEQIAPSIEGDQKTSEQYRKVACDRCGLIVPQNLAIPWNEEKRVGRSGPSNRSTFSFGSKSWRQSSSRYSGREYFKEGRIFLCAACAAAAYKVAQEKLKSKLIACGVIVAAFVVLAIVGSLPK